MAITPVQLQDYIIARLVALFPGMQNADGPTIHASFGVSGGFEGDDGLMQARYGIDSADAGRVLRGWYVEWDRMDPFRDVTKPIGFHGVDNTDRWNLNGIYEIPDGDSDTAYQRYMTDVHAIVEWFRTNPTFDIDATAVTTVTEDVGGVVYDSNTQEAEWLAGSQVYRPVLTLATKYRQR